MAENDGAATDERTSDFLDVENVAHNLAIQLSRLDEESSRYTAAATSLDGAAEAARELAQVVREVADGVGRGLEVISSVGGPEIMKKLARIETQQAENAETLLKKTGLAVNLAGAAAFFGLVAVAISILM